MAAPTIDAETPALYPPTLDPPPGPLPLWRFLPAFVRNPLRALPIQAYEGDILLVKRMGVTIAWVSAPALVEQVLVTDAARVTKSLIEKRVFKASLAGSVLISDGEAWRWQRRALAPLFRPTDLHVHVPAMVAAAEAQVMRWRQVEVRGVRAVDVDMTRVTYDVILATMLVGGKPAEADAVLAAGHDFLARASWDMAFALLRIPAWVPHPATLQMRRASARLRNSVAAIIARRRASFGPVATAGSAANDHGAPSDLLGRLLSARHPDTGEPMPDALVVSNLLTLLEAGHETTAKALTWTLYLLARAPEWQDRVHAEVTRIAGDAPITADMIARLEVTQRVLKEAMRLYPPAPVMARAVAETITLGPHRLPVGAQIVIPIYAIHRHRRLWNDPDRFDPDRFLPAAEAGRPRTQYMPFGGGARICIGASFAMIEATALLATFIRAARFTWYGGHRPEPVSRVTLLPAGGMPLMVEMRHLPGR